MTPATVAMIAGLLISQFASAATRERRLAKGKTWYPPIPIILLCVWGLAGNIVLVLQMLRTATHNDNAYVMLIPIVLSTCCFIGYWRMKKWGVISYGVVFILAQIISLYLIGWPSLLSTIPPVLFLYIGYANFMDMT